MKEQIGRVTATIRKFHPEIEQNNLDLNVNYDEAEDRYLVKLSKSGETVGAYLDQKDVDDCLEGKKCVNLAVQVTQLIAELEDLLTPRKPG
jgi:hypothetical protein